MDFYEAGANYFKKFKSIQVDKDDSNVNCDICLMNEKNIVKYGPFVRKSNIKCHYYCLLTGTNIPQSGSDISGICGFKIADINNAIADNKINICYICGKKSAAIECNEPNCTRRFHYICGYKNDCLSQFQGDFQSFCHEHHRIKHNIPNPEIQPCFICFEEMGSFSNLSWIIPDCCVVDQLGTLQTFHRQCLATYALNAGYYFRCPSCYNSSFSQEVKSKGVFVPDREAMWELEQGAFKDLHKNKCTIIPCIEKYNKKTLIACKACGGQLAHKKCIEVEEVDDYFCSRCMDATFIHLL